MDRNLFAEAEVTARFLFETSRRIGHIKSATAITDRQPVREDVLAKLDCHLRIERLHKALTKNISRDDVRMSRTKDQIAVGVNSGPIERHETALIAERIEVVTKPVCKIFST